MSVSALRTNTPRGSFSHGKRARRFWRSMAVVLREVDGRAGEALGEDVDTYSAGSVRPALAAA